MSEHEFELRLVTALFCGLAIGLERQWRQRIGMRTNTLVAVGACLFVLLSLSFRHTASPDRIAAQVVSGVGFLGAGVILRDGQKVRGINTAATIWCSAAIGVLCGLGHMLLPLILTLTVLLTNTVLRPLAYRLHPALSTVQDAETVYAITLTCRSVDETHLRPLLLAAVSQAHAMLQAIHREDESAENRTRLRADITTAGRRNEEVEQIAMRLSLEPGVTSLSWSIVPTTAE